MRFPAKKNAGCPKALRDFPPRKDGISTPARVGLGLPPPPASPRVCTGVRTLTSQPNLPNCLALTDYQICLAMVLCWRAARAGSAKIVDV